MIVLSAGCPCVRQSRTQKKASTTEARRHGEKLKAKVKSQNFNTEDMGKLSEDAESSNLLKNQRGICSMRQDVLELRGYDSRRQLLRRVGQ